MSAKNNAFNQIATLNKFCRQDIAATAMIQAFGYFGYPTFSLLVLRVTNINFLLTKSADH